ncbi:MAG TPA: CoA-binding protein [Cyclobacteriaceae bacterium]|nr:CoA-binding protein [Cyclobacteriaceae bacterium]
MKKTVIIGASDNPARYAQIASGMLREYDHPIVPLGIHGGEHRGVPILNLKEKPHIEDVDTVTLYLSPKNQEEWYDYILSLAPKRIIFNPGTENQELMGKARAAGIETVMGCTLVMLRTGQY